MAAGSGTRMGGPLPKQFLELEGKAILQHTIEVFRQACPDISVVVVLSPDYIGYWKDYCIRHNFICPQVLVPGGITRFHSVRNALDRIPDGVLVAVHDGVRPLVTSQADVRSGAGGAGIDSRDSLCGHTEGIAKEQRCARSGDSSDNRRRTCRQVRPIRRPDSSDFPFRDYQKSLQTAIRHSLYG